MGDAIQQNVPEDAAAGEGVPEKSAKQLKKEAEKAAKLEKLKAKLEKKTVAAATCPKPKTESRRKVPSGNEVKVYTAKTAPGERKDTSEALPDSYSPQYVEAAWYDWWEKQGFFKPEYGRKSILNVRDEDKFVMMIPPPNVTGSLHLGHALTNAVEDCLARWQRMRGKMVLWCPGCDHAGIATQVVVEKKLWRDDKTTRHDLGRDKFIEKVWEWKQQKGDRIYSQLRSLGSSLDWDRARFTMDPSMSRAVAEAFIRLHESGDIYRANRLVNWSCCLKSAISDIEVDKQELTGRTMVRVPGYSEMVEVGVLVSFAYKLSDSDAEVVVATTRVETMLGDTAVAVHPDDDRYKHLVGKKLKHPFNDRLLPIIADSYVDKEFGTGAVKITPAHDPNDYDMGKRHQLPFVNILEDDGTIVAGYGKFSGLHRYACRKLVVSELETRGLLRGRVDHAMVLPVCSRTKDIVEPLLKPQWYIKCDQMAEKAARAVRDGELVITPSSHEKTWFRWMEGIRDWCISRQLWWGHRIPAYRVTRPADQGEELWVSAHSEQEARDKAAALLGAAPAAVQLERDADVLDTWFSSALFPFASFGWPERTEDLEAFYPGTLLETGHDILFFWVARMVFFGQRLMGKLPFKQVYLHPMVRDAHGRKMSKSLGNVVDPTDVVRGISLEALQAQLADSNLDPRELDVAMRGQRKDYPNGIPECGTDALRFALCALTKGRDLNLDILRVQGYRFFCNKMWNAFKFAHMYFKQGETYELVPPGAPDSYGLVERWLLSRLASVVSKMNESLAAFDLPAATQAFHSFWLYDFCDVYLEYLKVLQADSEDARRLPRRVLFTCLHQALRLVAPFMPFISEELFQRLPAADRGAPSVCVAPYPATEDTCAWRDAALEGDVEAVMRVVQLVRFQRLDYSVGGKQWTAAHLTTIDGSEDARSVRLRELFEALAPLVVTRYSAAAPPRAGCARLPLADHMECHLVLEGIVDPEKEKSKLLVKMEQTRQTIGKMEEAAAVPNYQVKVPEDVRKANEEKLKNATVELERMTKAIEQLSLFSQPTQ